MFMAQNTHSAGGCRLAESITYFTGYSTASLYFSALESREVSRLLSLSSLQLSEPARPA